MCTCGKYDLDEELDKLSVDYYNENKEEKNLQASIIYTLKQMMSKWN